MIIKFLQINIYRGKYLDMLIDFLQATKPDIVSMQEVTSGYANLCSDKNVNLFSFIKKGTGLDGVFYPIVKIVDKPDSFQGNALLTRFPIIESNYFKLKDYSGITLEEFEQTRLSPDLPKGVVEVKFDINDKEFYAMSCHGAWTENPVDTDEKVRQAKMIASYLKSFDKPFILGADMNMPPKTEVVNIISESCVNWILKSNIKRTTHPVVHKTVNSIPEGLLVDYIFTSKHLKLKSIEAPDVLVSDHLPLVAELELKD